MNRIKCLICVFLALMLALAFASCGNSKDTDTGLNCDTPSDTSTDNDLDSNVNTDTSSNTDTIIDSTLDTSSDLATDTDSFVDTSVNSDTGEINSTATGTTTDLPPDPEPDPEPTPPVDVTINLFENGKSEYTIAYPKGNSVIEAAIKDFVNHVKQKYNIELPYKAVDKDKDIADKEIVVGYVRNNVLYAAANMSTRNDFVLGVCDNDYVIYTANDAMYPYAFRILEDEILSKTENGTLTITPEEKYLYKQSEYKDITFVQYLKNKKGSYNRDLLCELFIDMSYTAADGTAIPYRLYMPSDYNKSKDYPVILFLHGAGERGNDNYSHMNNMVPNMFNQESSLIHDAIVICPQCPAGEQWVDTPWANGNYSVDNVPESNELKAVLEILDFIKNSYSTDENRYYAMGISMGGFGTWDLLMRHTELFAAGVPICGGADTAYAEKLKDMPIYTAHAQNDKEVPYNGTKEMIDALGLVGSECIVFKSLSGGNHVIWGQFGDDSEMLKWLFEKAKQ